MPKVRLELVFYCWNCYNYRVERPKGNVCSKCLDELTKDWPEEDHHLLEKQGKMARKIKFEVIAGPHEDTFCQLVVYVDGKQVATGCYGGEPEDNSRSRDYSWVETAIKNVAKELCPDVETEYVFKDDEDEE